VNTHRALLASKLGRNESVGPIEIENTALVEARFLTERACSLIRIE